MDGKFGRGTTRALQLFLKAVGEYQGQPADGSFGGQSKRALQTLLETQGYCPGPVDGNFGHVSARSMQTWLHDEGFTCGTKNGTTGNWNDGKWGAGTTEGLQRFLNARRTAARPLHLKRATEEPTRPSLAQMVATLKEQLGIDAGATMLEAVDSACAKLGLMPDETEALSVYAKAERCYHMVMS